MTDHEMILLRAAGEAAPVGLTWWHSRSSGLFCAMKIRGAKLYTGPTLADALSALLADLGADVPEWPSEERVREIRGERLSRDEYERLTDLSLPEYLALRGGL